MQAAVDRQVAVVTGGSRGAGRGVAVALGREGYKVHVTGRSRTQDEAPLPGMVFKTARSNETHRFDT